MKTKKIKLGEATAADLETLKRCPLCAKNNALHCVDGDTVQGCYDGGRDVAGGLAIARDRHCFFAMLELFECDGCAAECFFVELRIVNALDVSVEWFDKYFCDNQRHTEPETARTASGLYDRHVFGPFLANETLRGPYGVACCSGGEVWDFASRLVCNVWPLVTGARVKRRRVQDDDLIAF